MSELILIKGKLSAAAKGFWFTSGGEKGAFGYYPHLKNSRRQPVYPDTQVQGDLRMAANWLLARGYKGDKNTAYKKLFEKIFGHGGIKGEPEKSANSMFYPTDLTLKADSIGKWIDKRFVVKTRIAIDDDRRNVEKHMLVDLELAWLDGLNLESTLYLGYFKTEEEAKTAWTFLQDALPLLSGFGAFRSRGFGRGKLKLDNWEQVEKIIFQSETAGDYQKERSVPYFLEALTNVRNKRIEPGRTQLVDSHYCITDKQLRSWFVNAYFHLNNKKWPTMDEIRTIHFPTLYPCPDASHYYYPAPMTSLRLGEGRYEDMWGKERENDPDNKQNVSGQTSDAKQVKPKAVKENEFVSNKPDVFTLQTKIRMRNALDADFQSRKSGLFAQELIPAGTFFGGEIILECPDSEFARKAKQILFNLRPLIKGAAFLPCCKARHSDALKTCEASLLIKPLMGEKMIAMVRHITEPVNKLNSKTSSIRLTTLREYSTKLKRPRRNRMAIGAGSVLQEAVPEQTVYWNGCGKEYGSVEQNAEQITSPTGGKLETSKYAGIEKMIADLFALKDWKDHTLTRAQAGVLRDFLNPEILQPAALSMLNQRLLTHQKRQDKGQIRLYTDLVKVAGENGMDGVRYYIRLLRQRLELAWWAKKTHKAAKKGTADHES